MTLLAEYVLELLKDDKWHEIDEIAKTFNKQEDLIRYILYFYEEFGFIEFDDERKSVVIDPKTRELFP